MSYAACFLAAFALFLVSASPTVSFEDTGELIAVAACLGVTHPPGYPWLTMLGSLFLHLPVGDPAFRLNLMSALFGAAAVTTVFGIARLVQGRLPVSSFCGAAPWIAAIAFATSKTLWWQAGIAEKYTLSVTLMMLTLLALVHAWLARRTVSLGIAAFLMGLALSHHLHGLYLIPVTGLVAWRLLFRERADHGRKFRRVLLLLMLAALPVLAKSLAIPIRAAAGPPMNWQIPDRADRWLAYLTARQYRFIMLSNEGPAEIAGRAVKHMTTLPLLEFGPALALAVPGLAALRTAAAGLLPGAGLLLATNLFFAVSYNTPEIERYYLFSYAVLAALMGLGAVQLLRSRLLRSRLLWGLAVLACLLVPVWQNGRVSPRTRHYLAYDFAINQLGPLPAGALLICEGDDQAFPLFYLNDVMRYRTDVHVVPMPTACWEPAYDQLPRFHPGLVLPPFVQNPGLHLPRIIAANAHLHPSFYTPGCTGAGSEHHLIPRGAVFEAYATRESQAVARRIFRGFPALRFRGAVEAHRYGDAVTLRAVRHYGVALAFHGALAMEHGKYALAGRYLSAAIRLPMKSRPHAAALCHLALLHGLKGQPERGAPLYRQALALQPDFAPALLGLGKLLLFMRKNYPEARALLRQAAEAPEFLTIRERQELQVLVSKLR